MDKNTSNDDSSKHFTMMLQIEIKKELSTIAPNKTTYSIQDIYTALQKIGWNKFENRNCIAINKGGRNKGKQCNSLVYFSDYCGLHSHKIQNQP